MDKKLDTTAKKLDIDKTYKLLCKEFPRRETPLNYKQSYELAIAVILSAQCTDERVNMVTPALFDRYPKLKALSQAKVENIEKLIFSTGFYKNKAKNILGFCQILEKEYKGLIPKDMKALLKMPGVGRKTANVILQELYGITIGIVVDTHVSRISLVFGLSQVRNPIVVERDLMRQIKKEYWRDWSLLMIFLGRKYCKAHQRLCDTCPLEKICPSAHKQG